MQRRDACPATLFSTCGDPSTRSSNSLAQGDRRERYRSNIAELGVLQEAHVVPICPRFYGTLCDHAEVSPDSKPSVNNPFRLCWLATWYESRVFRSVTVA